MLCVTGTLAGHRYLDRHDKQYQRNMLCGKIKECNGAGGLWVTLDEVIMEDLMEEEAFK